ncbi:MAG: NfeD family protein, partial [Chloroflexi bacterium]|nr:NfeD family protein [Chloroflexota bacterium]
IARSEIERSLPVGQRVRVLRVEGLRLLVRPEGPPPAAKAVALGDPVSGGAAPAADVREADGPAAASADPASTAPAAPAAAPADIAADGPSAASAGPASTAPAATAAAPADIAAAERR